MPKPSPAAVPAVTGAAKTPAPELVRDGLRKEILSGELAGGTQLRQDELADRFGTSRIPVREALRQLETEGLVTIHPNKGAVVSSLSTDEVMEMLDIRMVLECGALKLAIPNMADDDFETAERILDDYDRAPDPMRWSESNWRFHETLYAPCDRPKLLGLIETNYSQINRFMRMQISRAAGKEQPQEEHRRLLDLCRRQAVEPAVKLLEKHIQKTQKSLAAVLRRTQQGAA